MSNTAAFRTHFAWEFSFWPTVYTCVGLAKSARRQVDLTGNPLSHPYSRCDAAAHLFSESAYRLVAAWNVTSQL